MTPPYASAAARDADSETRAEHPVPFSFELFPPRNAQVEATMPAIVEELASLGPEFLSVTYGAGGSSRGKSLDLLRHIRDATDAVPLAHLTCVGSSYAEAIDLVREFLDNGITNFLALRGDPPKGFSEGDDFLGDLKTGAELAQLIHRVRAEHEDYVSGSAERGCADRWRVGKRRTATVAVAAYPNGHPQSRDIQQDYDALLAKEAAGANLALTQLFFHADDYFRFVDGAKAAGVTMPIVPGLLAVTSTKRLQRMADLAGEEIPVGLYRSLDRAKSDGARREIGIAHTTAQALDLIDGGAPGIHLYTQNRVDEPTEILARMGVVPRSRIRSAERRQAEFERLAQRLAAGGPATDASPALSAGAPGRMRGPQPAVA